MKKESKTWIRTFLSSFLATVCGIIITFGVNNCVSASRKSETARLLAEQTVKKMERTHQQLHEYQDLYDTIDSTSMVLHLAILADTLERVDEAVATTFINATLLDYVRYLHELPEFNVYYSRMQNVRLTLQEIDKAMLGELDGCMKILGLGSLG